MEDILYPSITPYNTGMLKVSELHSIYYEEYGNPEGIPVVRLHGGPGGASKANNAQFFNQKKYRIILFDQRGCGKSTPTGELTDNTAQYLIEDMEALRQHLSITKWHVFGGSWGSTLALTYAIKHTEKVSALIVYGIFLDTQWMFDWFGEEGLGKLYPDAYAELQKHLPANSNEERLKLRQQLLDGSREDQLRATKFTDFEGAGMTFFLEEEEAVTLSPEEQKAEEDSAIQYAKIYLHYEANNFFLPENYILENAHKLKHIQGSITHGRYDLCCPVKAAWDLHQAWPTASFHIIHNAAHRTEPPLAKALIEATNTYAQT